MALNNGCDWLSWIIPRLQLNKLNRDGKGNSGHPLSLIVASQNMDNGFPDIAEWQSASENGTHEKSSS